MTFSLVTAGLGASLYASSAFGQDSPWFTSVYGGATVTERDDGNSNDRSEGQYLGVSAARDVGADWSLGMAIDAFATDADIDGAPDITTDGASLTAFATWFNGPFFVDGAASIGTETQEFTRLAANPNLASRETNGAAYGVSLSVGSNFAMGAWSLSPQLSMSFDTASFDGVFIETENVQLNRDETLNTISAEAGGSVGLLDGAIRPEASAYLVYIAADTDSLFGQRLVNSPGSRTQLISSNDEEFWLDLGLGIAADLGDMATLRLSGYTSVARQDVTSGAISVSLSRSW